ncbi:hypothetical protein [Micromonospora sp. NPDC049679]|uniref:hypothetical protein n=1 Tax=Micromonospora sp. NPDC049679 TaxID=3155920 RepID=UPI0033FA046B
MHRRISKKHMLGGVAAAGVLAVGIAAPAVAFADPSSPSAPSSSTTGDKGGAEHKKLRAEHQDQLAEKLANELGVPKEKVTAALTKIKEQHRATKPDGASAEKFKAERKAEHQAKLKERLAEAVAQGKLTKEQADAITKAAEAGVLPGFGAKPGMPQAK